MSLVLAYFSSFSKSCGHEVNTLEPDNLCTQIWLGWWPLMGCRHWWSKRGMANWHVVTKKEIPPDMNGQNGQIWLIICQGPGQCCIIPAQWWPLISFLCDLMESRTSKTTNLVASTQYQLVMSLTKDVSESFINLDLEALLLFGWPMTSGGGKTGAELSLSRQCMLMFPCPTPWVRSLNWLFPKNSEHLFLPLRPLTSRLSITISLYKAQMAPTYFLYPLSLAWASLPCLTLPGELLVVDDYM